MEEKIKELVTSIIDHILASKLNIGFISDSVERELYLAIFELIVEFIPKLLDI